MVIRSGLLSTSAGYGGHLGIARVFSHTFLFSHMIIVSCGFIM